MRNDSPWDADYFRLKVFGFGNAFTKKKTKTPFLHSLSLHFSQEWMLTQVTWPNYKNRSANIFKKYSKEMNFFSYIKMSTKPRWLNLVVNWWLHKFNNTSLIKKIKYNKGAFFKQIVFTLEQGCWIHDDLAQNISFYV